MVDKEQLEYVSPYSAGSSTADDMTTGQFEYHLVQATEMFDEIDTGVPTTTATYCKLLLVAHFYECAQGRTAFGSEGIGDYSYSRMAQTGLTPYLTSFQQQVMDLLGKFGGSSAYMTEAGTRCDSDLLGSFALDADDQRKYPTI